MHDIVSLLTFFQMSVVSVLGSVRRKFKYTNERMNLILKLKTVAGLFVGSLVLLLAVWIMKKIFQSRYEVVDMNVRPDIIFITISAALLPAIGNFKKSEKRKYCSGILNCQSDE